MAFCATGDEKYRYFQHKGVYYGTGTKVTLSDAFISRYTYRGRCLWKYAWFGNRITVNGKNMYFFSRDKSDWYFLRQNNISREYVDQTCPYFLVDEDLLDIAIEQVTYPIMVDLPPEEKKKDWEVDKVMWGWVTYIAALIFSLIFKEFYLIWFWATIIFYFYRKEKLTQ